MVLGLKKRMLSYLGVLIVCTWKGLSLAPVGSITKVVEYVSTKQDKQKEQLAGVLKLLPNQKIMHYRVNPKYVNSNTPLEKYKNAGCYVVSLSEILDKSRSVFTTKNLHLTCQFITQIGRLFQRKEQCIELSTIQVLFDSEMQHIIALFTLSEMPCYPNGYESTVDETWVGVMMLMFRVIVLNKEQRACQELLKRYKLATDTATDVVRIWTNDLLVDPVVREYVLSVIHSANMNVKIVPGEFIEKTASLMAKPQTHSEDADEQYLETIFAPKNEVQGDCLSQSTIERRSIENVSMVSGFIANMRFVNGEDFREPEEIDTEEYEKIEKGAKVIETLNTTVYKKPKKVYRKIKRNYSEDARVTLINKIECIHRQLLLYECGLTSYKWYQYSTDEKTYLIQEMELGGEDLRRSIINQHPEQRTESQKIKLLRKYTYRVLEVYQKCLRAGVLLSDSKLNNILHRLQGEGCVVIDFDTLIVEIFREWTEEEQLYLLYEGFYPVIELLVILFCPKAAVLFDAYVNQYGKESWIYKIAPTHSMCFVHWVITQHPIIEFLRKSLKSAPSEARILFENIISFIEERLAMVEPISELKSESLLSRFLISPPQRALMRAA